MAVTSGRGLRIAIADRSWDAEQGSDLGDLILAGPGEATLMLPGERVPRRVLWRRAGAAGERSGGSPANPLGNGAGASSARLEIVVDGWRFELTVEDLGRARLRERARRGATSAAAHASLAIRAPIPGRIASVRVVEGETVPSGAALLTLDAMKMENIVRAPRAGTIGRVAVASGQTVELGDTLLELA